MKKKSHNKTLIEMKNIYYRNIPKDHEYLDWMGYPIDEENTPSYHHIVKQSTLKSEQQEVDSSIENGAYLGTESHAVLHYIEKIDKDLYQAWNYIFLVINKMGIYPIDDIWEIIFHLQELTDQTIDAHLAKKEKQKQQKNGKQLEKRRN